MSGEEHLPQVKEISPAGRDTITLTLESGEIVSLTASAGTCMHPSGVLVSDYKNNGPVYFIPSPHQRWQAKVWLGLYGGEQDSEEARFDAYLMQLGSITEVDCTDGVLTLAHVNSAGERGFAQFSGDVTVIYTWDPSDGGFTRYPLQVAVQEGEGQGMTLTYFRIDHTPEGYAALTALGWDSPLPSLEARR